MVVGDGNTYRKDSIMSKFIAAVAAAALTLALWAGFASANDRAQEIAAEVGGVVCTSDTARHGYYIVVAGDYGDSYFTDDGYLVVSSPRGAVCAPSPG